MKKLQFEEREGWLNARRGKITGSELKKLVPSGNINKAQLLAEAEKKGVEFKKSWTIAQLNALFTEDELKEMEIQSILQAEKLQGYYKLIADKLTIDDNTETPLEHGISTEAEALEVFAKAYDLNINTGTVIWEREDVPGIAISPDGSEEAKVVTFAVEIKCLDSSNHIKAILTDTIPSEFDHQKNQYFAVNDDLQKLYFVLYDPRFIVEKLKMKVFEISRDEVQDDVDMLIRYETDTLKEVNKIVNDLSF